MLKAPFAHPPHQRFGLTHGQYPIASTTDGTSLASAAAGTATVGVRFANGGGTPTPASALYVAVNGNDSNAGTLSAPLQTIQRAVDLAQPGYTIFPRGGTYAPSTNIRLLKDGTLSQPITMRNYENERVIIDGENMP